MCTCTYLRVDRHYRLPRLLKLPHPFVDVSELPVPVRMLPAFQRLAVRLQTVAQRVQQPVHAALAHRVPLRLQGLRQPRRSPACPAQRTHRIPPRDRIQLALQGRPQLRVPLAQRPAPAQAAPHADPAARCTGSSPPSISRRHRPHRVARQAGRIRHRGNPASANRPPFHSRPQAPRPLIQHRPQPFETNLDALRQRTHALDDIDPKP